MKYVYLVLLLILFCNCSSKKEEHRGCLASISLADLSFDKSLRLSNFASSVEAIPLETTDESLIGEIRKVIYRNGLYYLRVTNGFTNSRILVFSRTGHFLFKIDKQGQGKGEYIDMGDFILTPRSNIKVLSWSKIVTYDSLGNYLHESPMSYYADDAIAYDNGYLITHTTLGPKNRKLLVAFTNEDKKIALFFNRSRLEANKLLYFHGLNAFSRCGNQVYFHYSLCDTIYSVASIDHVSPTFYLDFGKYKIDYSDVTDVDKCLDIEKKNSCKDYIRVFGFQVLPNYLVLALGKNGETVSLCFYSFKTNKFMNGINIIDDMYFKGCVFPLRYRNLPISVIDNYLYCSVSSSLLLQAYKKYKESISSGDWNEFKRRYPNIVDICKSISNEDNPILLRVRIKK